jgi:hypothetical protein
MAFFKKKPKKPEVKPIIPKPYKSEREGRGKCSHCGVVNGHTASCAKGGS